MSAAFATHLVTFLAGVLAGVWLMYAPAPTWEDRNIWTHDDDHPSHRRHDS